jgi:hypothetical protein
MKIYDHNRGGGVDGQIYLLRQTIERIWEEIKAEKEETKRVMLRTLELEHGPEFLSKVEEILNEDE